MSRRNRDRRAFWCQSPKCGVRLDRREAAAGLAETAALCRCLGIPPGPALFVCVGCRTPHVYDRDRGGIRLLTPAERLQAEIEVPAALRAIAAGQVRRPSVFTSEVPGGAPRRTGGGRSGPTALTTARGSF